MTTSLLIPAYNAAAHLPRLWETVRAQTAAFTEILCYDDASTDDTAVVAQRLGARVLRGEHNHGPAHARNELLHAAAGDWVHFHDADDLLEPAFLERMSAHAGPGVDAVVCNVDWLEERTQRRMFAHRYSRSELLAGPLNYVLEHPIGGINGLYRRERLLMLGGFDESMRIWEDADLHVRLAAHGAHIDVVEEVLSLAMRRAESVSTDYRANWRCRLEALQRYERVLPESARGALAREAERAALNLAGLDERRAAGAAVALARRLGGDPPTSRSWAVRVAKRVLPTVWLLRLQASRRTAKERLPPSSVHSSP